MEDPCRGKGNYCVTMLRAWTGALRLKVGLLRGASAWDAARESLSSMSCKLYCKHRGMPLRAAARGYEKAPERRLALECRKNRHSDHIIIIIIIMIIIITV